MSEPARDREARDAPAPDRQRPSVGDAPRWVAPVSIVVAVLFVAVLVLLHLTGSIGPGAH